MKPWTEARNNKYMKYHSKLTYQLSFWNVSRVHMHVYICKYKYPNDHLKALFLAYSYYRGYRILANEFWPQIAFIWERIYNNTMRYQNISQFTSKVDSLWCRRICFQRNEYPRRLYSRQKTSWRDYRVLYSWDTFHWGVFHRSSNSMQFSFCCHLSST